MIQNSYRVTYMDMVGSCNFLYKITELNSNVSGHRIFFYVIRVQIPF